MHVISIQVEISSDVLFFMCPNRDTHTPLKRTYKMVRFLRMSIFSMKGVHVLRFKIRPVFLRNQD